MSGHSKWASIKHQKAATDKKRSNLFTKLANNISVAARAGGDPEMNYSLRLAIEKGKEANMPKDNIERAIKRGTGELGGAAIEDVSYEVYGPQGAAIIVNALTDNKNRTSAEVKAVLNKLGGKMAGSGSVQFLFQKQGILDLSLDGRDRDEIEEKILESGALDYVQGDSFLVYTSAQELKNVAEFLQNEGIKINSREIALVPKETVELDEENSKKVLKLLEALDDLDDVTEVNSNVG